MEWPTAHSGDQGIRPLEDPIEPGPETIAVGRLGETEPEARLDAIDTLLEEALGGTNAIHSETTSNVPKALEDTSDLSLQLIATTFGDESPESLVGREVLDVSFDVQQARLDRLYQVETVNIDAILQAVEPTAEIREDEFAASFGEGYDVIEPEPPETYRESESAAPDEADRLDQASYPTGRRPGLRLEPARRPDSPHRPYVRLFSKLRRRQEESESAY